MNRVTHIIEGEFEKGIFVKFFRIRKVNNDSDVVSISVCAEYFPDRFRLGKKSKFRVTITKI